MVPPALRLTPAQRSALECAGLELEPVSADEAVLQRCLVEGRVLYIPAADREAVWRAVNELSNAEDAHYQATKDPYAYRAASTLATLAGKILRSDK